MDNLLSFHLIYHHMFLIFPMISRLCLRGHDNISGKATGCSKGAIAMRTICLLRSTISLNAASDIVPNFFCILSLIENSIKF